MTRTFWTIWDCASYDVIMEMMDEGAVPNLRRIMKKGKYYPVVLNKFNSQTPCALAMQFTGEDSETLDIGGYHTPNYNLNEDKTSYYPTFANREIGNKVAWHQKYIGKKKIALSQIPYSLESTNDIYGINGFSKKLSSYILLKEDYLLKENISIKIGKHDFVFSLLQKSDIRYINVESKTCNVNKNIKVNTNSDNDFWVSENSGFKLFSYTDENDSVFALVTDAWEYELSKINMNDSFRNEVGVFMGGAYGRLYRRGDFGKPFYAGGTGRAEDIYFLLLEQVAVFFTRANEFLFESGNYDSIISYQPCVDEANHEFYGWWERSEGDKKNFYWKLLKKAYNLADKHLGTILDKMSDSDNIIVTSDHGVYGVKYEFYINEYCKRNNLLCADGNRIIENKSKIYYHPADTGALYLSDEQNIDSILNKLLNLEISGHKIIKEIIKPRNKVMGDYFLVPEKGIKICAGFSDEILTETVKSGCHTINTNESSMCAICFTYNSNLNNWPSSVTKIDYSLISEIYKDCMQQ